MDAFNSSKFLTPKDISGKTIQDLQILIEQGWELNEQAKYCFLRAKHRLQSFMKFYSQVITEEIVKIDPSYISSDLELAIYEGVKRLLFVPTVKRYEAELIMKFPDEGLLSTFELEDEALGSVQTQYRPILADQTRILTDGFREFIKEDGLEFLDKLPTYLNVIPLPPFALTLTNLLDFSYEAKINS